MDVFVLKTANGLDHDQLKDVYSDIGELTFIEQYKDEFGMRDAIPLTHFNIEKGKSIDPVALKLQHLNAWEELVKRNLQEAIVVLDTVRLVNSFVKGAHLSKPKNADLCIFSASNLKIRGTHLNGTDWVFLDSDDKDFNNICNAYLITQSAARKLYGRKNELLNTPEPFGMWINSISNYMAIDRIGTFMTFQSTSSKPIYIKSA